MEPLSDVVQATALGRIASALERIAAALERQGQYPVYFDPPSAPDPWQDATTWKKP